MRIFLKTTEKWDIILCRLALIFLAINISNALPLPDRPLSFPDANSTPSLRERVMQGVLKANLKSIVQREYARYFNTSWANRTNDAHECLLGPSQYYLWWLDSSGRIYPGLNTRTSVALDLSYKNLSERNLMELLQIVDVSSKDKNQNIYMLSLAYNNLTQVPKLFLSVLSSTLERLSMMGNNLTTIGKAPLGAKNTFPKMSKLKTIDLRYCNLVSIGEGAFDGLPNLTKLILSHNLIRKVDAAAFNPKNMLYHLDMSFNSELNKMDIEDVSAEKMEPFMSLMKGLLFPVGFFSKRLKKLRFLDLSHTKLNAMSGIALSYLGSDIEQLSLCYTNIPIIAEKMFEDTDLRVLDLSGNQALPTTFSNTSLAGLEDKLEIFAFENAYVKHIHFIGKLRNLQILKLHQNNINTIPLDTFTDLKQLKIIDVSSNHLSHWYERIIVNHTVQVLDLRDNNINVLSKEMIRDFQMVEYLAIGRNMFLCSCLMKDFLEMALKNTIRADCETKVQPLSDRNAHSLLVDQYDTYTRILNSYLRELKDHHETINEYFQQHHPNQNIDVFDPMTKSVIHQGCNYQDQHPRIVYLHELQIDESTVNKFKVQLLDYSEADYQCIESNSTQSFKIAELEPCSYADRVIMPANDMPTDVLILYPLLVVLSASVLIIFIYYRGYDIKYFCITFRNVTVLSLLDKDKRKLLNKRTKSEHDEYLYDVFVSYSEQNRDWVLDHLLPNIEQRDGINVCLHERDFKVGLTILENIISCIDQSRTILLVISQSFVSSNWCQFELHLAQHRLLETRREQLVLVLLESIPRITRPRTLQYLMRTKTYLKWPSEKRKKHRQINFTSQENLDEQRKLFFKRLKQAIVETP
ncbi:toll-like receptor Tollo [Culicoides brevitarsis]|uniref:toll-like receptor Tollo n=1 Tax=Culicoides brevitarsis TaxID=469753 RepID=UPI00307CB92F